MSTVKERIEVIKKKESKEGLNDWEKRFLSSLGQFRVISERQEACLKKIEVKLGIDEEEEPEYTDDYRPLDEKPGFSIGTMSNLDDDIPF
jgi:hypothetical protein